MAGLYGVAAAFTFIRDAALPVVLSTQDAEAWQRRLAPQLHFDWYWWVIGILVALLVVVLEGVFRVVQHEQTTFAIEGRTLKAEIQRLEASRELPDFEGRILQMVTPPDVPNGTLAFVNLTIRNRGFQSVVDHDWEASITIAGTKLPAELHAFQGTTTLVMAQGGPPIVITPADAIYEKAINDPITRGDQISGWLAMWVSGVRTDDFWRVGNVLEVTFKDFLSKSYVAASQPFDGKVTGRAHYFPGSQNPAPPRLSQTSKKGKR